MLPKIRIAEASDSKAVEELFREMLKSVYHTEDVHGYEEGYLDRFFAGGEDRILLACEQGKVIGYLSIEVHRSPERVYLYLDDFCVSQAYRNMGIGSILLDHAMQYARQLHIPEIFLHVEKTNVRAEAFYKRHGFGVYEDQGTRCLLVCHLF